MKNITTLIFALFLSAISIAQVKQNFTHQAVVRDASDNLVLSTNLGIRISILQGSAAGVSVFKEAHTATTNNNGLLTLIIGNGTPIARTIAGINWEKGPYFLKKEIDLAGGTNYTLTEVTEITSVPFALTAYKIGSKIKAFPIVTTLNCTPVVTGDLYANYNSIANMSLSYTGGNGDLYSNQTVSSTGVTGLTASRNAGFLNEGSGTVQYTISGTPNSTGTASFSIDLGGQTCTVAVTVITPTLVIGAPFQGGIIAYIDGSGLHGFVISKTNIDMNANDLHQWTISAFQNLTANASSDTDGSLNTNNCVAQAGTNITSTISTQYAAGLCKLYKSNGYTNWYLPAKNQSLSIYNNKTALNSGLTTNGGVSLFNGLYWTSTELDYQLSYLINMSNGALPTLTKNNSYMVRAIKSF
jgi:hypothetical protein